MKKIIFSSIAKAINASLGLDPESHQRLQKLRGKTISIELLPLHLTFQCIFHDDGVAVQEGDALAAATIIRGTPLQMLGAMTSKEDRQRFFSEDLAIEGDAEVAQQVVELFDELDIDWEEQLSKLIGDVPAYHAGRLLRGARKFLHSASTSLMENFTEYAQEEARWLPAREALQDYFNDIDTLRMDVDRAEAKLQNLLAQLNIREE